MARHMKSITPPTKTPHGLVGKLELLKVARGHRRLPRAVIHRSGKQLTRAQAKRSWQQELQK